MTVNVVLAVLGGFPSRHVTRRVTPTLWNLATDGGWAPDGGEAVMTSARDPNCTTFVTGATPNRHRMLANQWPADRVPRLPTLFGASRDAGRATAAIVADPELMTVIGATAADIRWAAASDADVVDTLVTLLDGDPPDLTIAQLSDPWHAARTYGPDSAAARDRYHATDALVGTLVELLRRRWHDTVLIVVSDHDVEPTTSAAPIDLESVIRRLGLRLDVVLEGGAALVLGADHQQGRWLADAHGVAGTIELTPELRLVWSRPGRVFGPSDMPVPLGTHGGPGTTSQVAIVGGGHRMAGALASVVGRRTPRAADWAVTIAELLHLDLPTATGRSLLGPTPVLTSKSPV